MSQRLVYVVQGPFGREDPPFGQELAISAADGSGRRRLTKHGVSGWRPEWRRGGRLITFTGTDSRTWLMEQNGRNAHVVFTAEDGSALSPDGRRVAWIMKDGDFGISTAGGLLLRRIRTRHVQSDTLEWSPDGRYVATEVMRERADDWTVLVLDTRTGSWRILTPRGLDAWRPVWSNDSRWIAFRVETSSGRDLWVVRADGSARARLAAGVDLSTDPLWSPDGKFVAFGRERPADVDDPDAPDAVIPVTLFVVPSSGGRARSVVRLNGVADGVAWSPRSDALATASHGSLIVASLGGRARRVGAASSVGAWAPNARILFNDRDDAIRSIRADGTRPWILTAALMNDESPVWSPDGKSVAFVRRFPTGPKIAVIGANGRGLKVLTAGERPSWSPDGAALHFTREPHLSPPRLARDDAVLSVALRGGAVTRIAQGSYPAWSQDGRRVAFVRNRYTIVTMAGQEFASVESSVLYVAAADGSGLRPLRDGADYWYGESDRGEVYSHLSWFPTGRALAAEGTAVNEDRHEFGPYALLLVDLETGAARSLPHFPYAWSPDGSRYATRVSGDVVLGATPEEHATTSVFRGPPPREIADSEVTALRFSPDGELLAMAVTEETRSQTILIVAIKSGSVVRRITGTSPDWSPG